MKGDHPIHATPSDVCAERGVVILDGPGNLAGGALADRL